MTADVSGPDAAGRPKYPYPGLRPFEAAEWSIFFGREVMIDEVIDRLAAHRLVLIYGSSGAGKSSLVRAGVLPKLERQHRRAGAPWQTCSMRPSSGPLWNLAKELARFEGTAEDPEHVARIVGEFSRRDATLSSVAGSLKGLQGQRLCLLVDQFEELFRFEKETSREEAELFVDLLVRGDVNSDADASEITTADSDAIAVHIVVTMRSEFLGDCARFSGLGEAVNRTQYLMPRMKREALLRAIRRPAQLYGGEVTLDLAERLIADAAGREDELPLIQHGLMLMWNQALAKQPDGPMVLNAGPLEIAGGLERMLSAHADEAVDAAEIDPQRRSVVERLFRALTDLNVEGKAIRRPQTFRDLVEATGKDADTARAVINELRRDGVSFLTPYAPAPITEGTTIDIGHEALIRCWKRLADPQNGWLKREFDDGLIWRSLLVEAKSFERDKRRVLSPATTAERFDWWRERQLNGAWAERYGGGFMLVEQLLTASKNAARQRLVNLAVVGALGICCAGLAYVGWTNRLLLQLWSDIYLRHTVLSPAQEQALKPADSFCECTRCPEMMVVPTARFIMGSDESQQAPEHAVELASRFAVARNELTFDEWDLCYQDGGCASPSYDWGWGRRHRPVILVTWHEARQYAVWLAKVTGQSYRLLSEAEYEYATRASSSTVYPWGNAIGKNNANCLGCESQWENKGTAPAGSFAPNKFGLYDMVGNVWEWTEDCWHDNYSGAPANGSAWITGDCRQRVVRGGAWSVDPSNLASAFRYWLPSESRFNQVGFRVARTLLSP